MNEFWAYLKGIERAEPPANKASQSGGHGTTVNNLECGIEIAGFKSLLSIEAST